MILVRNGWGSVGAAVTPGSDTDPVALVVRHFSPHHATVLRSVMASWQTGFPGVVCAVAHEITSEFLRAWWEKGVDGANHPAFLLSMEACGIQPLWVSIIDLNGSGSRSRMCHEWHWRKGCESIVVPAGVVLSVFVHIVRVSPATNYGPIFLHVYGEDAS